VATLKQDLIAQGLELRETHISWVFLGRELVYKVKKPVALGFLDFTALDARRRFCEAEVALNQRLAPSVYRGVVPITRGDDGVHRIGGRGEPVEWAVEMRRLAARDAADQRLLEGRLGRAEIDLLARTVAAFHARARCDAETSRFGARAMIEENVRENFAQTRDGATRFLSAAELARTERWQLGFLRDHEQRLAERVERGRIREGHGDLRLEHCYLDDQGGVDVIDCIEFNERFRYGDVCADVAFLSMDLSWHGRSDLSEAFLAAYARASNDYDLYGVVDFYESYRAYVRGKVSSLLEADAGVVPEARQRAAAEARKYYLLAEACTRDPLQPPALYAIGGVIASGKSTVAEQLAAWLHAPIVDADRTRKHLAGVDAFTSLADTAFAGSYSAQASAEVYAEVLRRAQVVLESRRSVVVDASFRSRSHRAAVQALAARCRVPFLFIECVVPPETARARLAARAQAPSVSDGRLEMFDAFVASYEPVDELPAAAHLRLMTDRPATETLAAIRQRIG
jgi:aminoglycoside phosphotransferase family enzyme/predicted kinase